MKPNQRKNKSMISLMLVTVLFVVGCSGGKDQDNTAESASRSASSSSPSAPKAVTPSPTLTEPTDFSVGANEGDELTADALAELKKEITAAKNAANKAASNSDDASDSSKFAFYGVLGLGALALLSMGKKAFDAKKSGAGIWDTVKAGIFNGDSYVQNKRNEDLKKSVNSDVQQALGPAFAGVALAGATAEEARTTGRETKQILTEGVMPALVDQSVRLDKIENQVVTMEGQQVKLNEVLANYGKVTAEIKGEVTLIKDKQGELIATVDKQGELIPTEKTMAAIKQNIEAIIKGQKEQLLASRQQAPTQASDETGSAEEDSAAAESTNTNARDAAQKPANLRTTEPPLATQ